MARISSPRQGPLTIEGGKLVKGGGKGRKGPGGTLDRWLGLMGETEEGSGKKAGGLVEGVRREVEDSGGGKE